MIRIARPQISVSAIYASGDAVGGLLNFGSLLTDMILQTVILTDLAKQDVATDLILFERGITPTADNAAFDPLDADLPWFIGAVSVSSYLDFNDSSAAIETGLGLLLPKSLDAHRLYGQLVTRGTPTYATTSDIIVKLVLVEA